MIARPAPRRVVPALAAAAVVAASLGACTGGAAEPPRPSASTSTPAPSASPGGTTAPGDAPTGDAGGTAAPGAGAGGAGAGGAGGGGADAGGGAGRPDPGAPARPEPAAVAVVVTFSGWNTLTSALEVGGYADTVEQGGTCTLRLAGPGGATAEVSGSALPDAASTTCGLLAVPRDRLAAGSWTGTLSYASATSAGEVAVPAVAVP